MSKRRAENNIKKTKRKIKKMSIDKLENQIIVDESIGSMTLNQDCLSKIFRYLSIENKLNVEKVCLAWKKAAKWSWSNIKIFTLDKNKFSINNEQLIESLYLKKILTRCKIYLQHLKIRDILDENLVPLFDKSWPNLTKLDLKLNGYEFQKLDKLFYNMECLKCIIVKNLIHITNEFLQQLQYLSKNIEEIHLFCSPLNSICDFDYCNEQSSNTLVPTFEKFDNLKSLTINGYKLDENIIKIISNKKKLIYLSLSRCELETTSCLTMILNLNNLETLKLRSVKIVDDLFLYNLSRKCLNLKHLNLAQCNKVSDTGIIELTKLDKLEELILNRSTNNIVDISDKSIRQFRNLKKLHCFGCDCVTHDGIIKVLKNSPELELLDIGNTEVSPTIFLPIASSLTRHRTNNIILTLKVDLVWDIFAPDPRKTIEPSPYLIIDKS